MYPVLFGVRTLIGRRLSNWYYASMKMGMETLMSQAVQLSIKLFVTKLAGMFFFFLVDLLMLLQVFLLRKYSSTSVALHPDAVSF